MTKATRFAICNLPFAMISGRDHFRLGDIMQLPSKKGLEIEQAIAADWRFTELKKVQYLCVFRTLTGCVFAFERTTLKAIIFWLPENQLLKDKAEEAGLSVWLTQPYSSRPKSEKYGRLSSLRSVPQLGSAALFRIKVGSAEEALKILSVVC